MNPEQKKLLLNEYFETGGSTSTLEIFQVLVVWKKRFRSTFKYATSDFTGISKCSSIKKARLRFPFSKALRLRGANKVLGLALELLLQIRSQNPF